MQQKHSNIIMTSCELQLAYTDWSHSYIRLNKMLIPQASDARARLQLSLKNELKVQNSAVILVPSCKNYQRAIQINSGDD